MVIKNYVEIQEEGVFKYVENQSPTLIKNRNEKKNVKNLFKIKIK